MPATGVASRMNHGFGQNHWFTTAREARPDDSVLYCLAHAGGNAEDYLHWQSGLSNDLLMKAVILPGTGRRYAEDYPADINTLTDTIAAAIAQEADKTFYLFGHSMGAILAWEVAKKLRTSANGLLISASLSPTEIPSPRIVKMAEMDNHTFIQEVAYFNGIDANLAHNSLINDIVSEKLKRDFKLISGYRHQYSAPIGTPIMAIVGENDAHVPLESLLKWQAHTQYFLGAKQVSGNHFYFNDYPEIIINAIDEMIRQSRKKIDDNSIFI
ncbi:thioesterase II family protein [Serratia sp. (in: enterobacteria)]|uniref:thioesterase II family protein n=1 Tax=Serratia sp. (in: enterobacteria) TaxID=616 RepID=UPI0039897C47